jgi:hypothetical protein
MPGIRCDQNPHQGALGASGSAASLANRIARHCDFHVSVV